MNAFCPPRHQTQRIELDLTPKQIEQLREVMDALPLRPYAPLIVAVLPKLPLDTTASTTPIHVGSDASPAALGPGFSLTAHTAAGCKHLPQIGRALSTLWDPFGEEELQ